MSGPIAPVPLYPVAERVLFPRALAPLHVHELRYRTMVRDVLSKGRTIALALLKPGWEGKDRSTRETFDLVCLARFEQVEWLPNDCYDLRLLGIARARIVRVVREFPYRSVRVEPLPQAPHSEDDPLVQMERAALLAACQKRAIRDALDPPLHSMDYEQLVNTACMRATGTPLERLEWLALDSVVERGRLVRARIESAPEQGPEPPAKPDGERN